LTSTLTTDQPRTNGTYHCAICDVSEPWTGEHRCQLDRSQRRRLDLWKRAERAAARARTAPTPCPDCRERMIPGQAHACRIQPTPGFQSPVEQIASALRQAGYRIQKENQ
jgi:hypothetical protein